MTSRSRLGADEESRFQVLWKDGERVLGRGWRLDAHGTRNPVLAVWPAAAHLTSASLERLAHEYNLRDDLDSAWAARPLDLLRKGAQTMLVLGDPGGEPLARLLDGPMELGRFLQLAIGIAAAVGQVHRRALIHKDINPANILAEPATGRAWLTGFGLASRLPRERQPVVPPETIAGTLAYMAPEQTGRMNRSIDARSDLYALGATLYQMLTGTLPFSAGEPMEWVHCHLARQPIPPAKRLAGIPQPVSAVILKLLAKAAEERYQTAGGLEADLRHCLAEWQAHNRIEAFLLGTRDLPDRLLIPERLYGREPEVESLLAAFNRVAIEGGAELVLVSGYSGIGKSAVVHELHKVLVPPRGLFAAGKFDQYKRDIPYATLAQAFQGLFRDLLAKSEAELALWRRALREALGPNGQLIVSLIPELELLIGPQPSVPELPPQDAQRRFQLVFRHLLGVFARPEHPLALFLDDLQWLDAATLDLLEHLATRSELRHLLLVGAYRDNEVTPTHPLTGRLAAIRSAGGRMQEIVLAPLDLEQVGRLTVDTLRCEPEHAAPLARLVHAKTGGNPFFIIQFLTALAEERLLAFDHGAARWTWDIERIHAKGYTDNVVDLMLGKLSRLPAATRAAMQHLACLGNSAATSTLTMVLGGNEGALHAALWEAVRAGLVLRLEGTYRFLHDRVQEAAYALITESDQAIEHLRIGRLLVAHTPPEKRWDAIFEIVNQLNRGADLITARNERDELAELNLIAGQQAKASTAYASALTYLTAGAALLKEDSWEHNREVTFALELHRAECEFLVGSPAEAEQRLVALSARGANTIERATVTCLRMDVYTTLGQSNRAIAAGLDYLKHLGIDWSPHPTDEDVQREYNRIWAQLGSRTIKDLIALPLMSDPESLATMDVLIKLGPPTYFTDTNLYALAVCQAANLSLERGNSDGSCDAYARLGLISGERFGDYKTGFGLGEVGCELVERSGLKRFQARTYMLFAAHIMPYARHVRAGRELLYRAFEIASMNGDLSFAAYCRFNLNENLLAVGDPLVEVEREVKHGLAFAQSMQFEFVNDFIESDLGLVRTLRGLTPTFGCLDSEHFDEGQIENRFASNPNLEMAACWYWIRKLQARFHAGDYASAIDAATRVQRPQLILIAADRHLYSALAHAASCDSVSPDERHQHVDALVEHHRQLQTWAEHCPENFDSRAALVAAEIARLEGRELDAERLFERAIRSAHDNGFVHNEALASELAAQFYSARDLEIISQAYLRNARQCYLRWGADGKVRQLDESYPHLREDGPVPRPPRTIGAPVEHLDLATVITVSQAVSGEIVLEKLLETLMHTAIEHAGAERGLLILARGAEPRLVTEATTSGDTVAMQLRDEPVTATALPEAVLHYVWRTQQVVVLDDASAPNPFVTDPYIAQHHARSVLCLPLLNQAKLIGVLYLENNLAPRVFAPARMAVLKLLASQAAISLENGRLYRDLSEREARIRQLVEANIIGIFLWNFDGRILEANDAFLHIVGYEREDLAAGCLRWTDLTPPEWHERDVQQWIPEHKRTGRLQPFEKEYFRKDGSRVPVLIGVTTFEDNSHEGVAFVLDLTEIKRAEAEARESEQRYREVQMELAHANRVATMGQLTASIAHEVNQPIAAAATNAHAALRWLQATPPDLKEACQALGRIGENAARAGEIIGRIRSLVKKTPLHKEALAINTAISEVIALLHGEVLKSGVVVRTQLAAGLSPVQGDRVQLQQVVLNLILNAVEAMHGISAGSRELWVSTESTTEGVCVSVRDSGPGLDAGKLERVFEAFYTTKPRGLGMGLAICRSIVETHGGRLWADVNEPQGAVFQFTLPDKPHETGSTGPGP